MSEECPTINLKTTWSDEVLLIPLANDPSVKELKTAVACVTSVDENDQILIYKGKILTDDKLMKDYNIQDSHTIVLVKNPNSSNTITYPEPDMGEIDQSQVKILKSVPICMHIINEVNAHPEMIDAILRNSQFKPILESNPLLKQVIAYPERMQVLQAIMNGPEGGEGPNTDASKAQPTKVDKNREKYADKIQQLVDMGFCDEDLNLEMLKKCGGNLDAAIEKILSTMG